MDRNERSGARFGLGTTVGEGGVVKTPICGSGSSSTLLAGECPSLLWLPFLDLAPGEELLLSGFA